MLQLIMEQPITFEEQDFNRYSVVDQTVFIDDKRLRLLYEIMEARVVVGTRLTLKGLIKEENPYQKKLISDTQKYIYRSSKHPVKVILYMEDNINSIRNQIKKAEQWTIDEDNILCLIGTEPTLQRDKPFIKMMNLTEARLEYGDPIKDNYQRFGALDQDRITAQVWGQALGWTFSAPPVSYRDADVNEGYWRKSRQQEQDYTGEWAWMGTGKTNKAFDREYKRQFNVATDAEITAFMEYFTSIKQFKEASFRSLLEPGWYVCPYCKKVHKKCNPIHENREICLYCGQLNPYYREVESIELKRMKEMGWDITDSTNEIIEDHDYDESEEN